MSLQLHDDQMMLRFENLSGRALARMLREGTIRIHCEADKIELHAESEELEKDNCHAVTVVGGDDPSVLLGVLVYTVQDELVNLRYIYVHEPLRNRKVGSELIRWAMFDNPNTMLVTKIKFVSGGREGNYLLPSIKRLPFLVEAIPCPWG